MNTRESITARIVKGDGCWKWTGSHGGKDRRPSVSYQGRSHYVYRLMWEWANGTAIPAGLEARHSCDNGWCVNPAHITPGTHAENMRDMSERGRSNTPVRYGDDNPNAYPTELVMAARAAYASGEFTKRQVADKFGVSFGAVDKWMKGVTRGFEPVRVRDGKFQPTAKCGERAGAAAHRRRGEPVCEDCKRADREYMAAWKAARRLAAAA